MSDLERLDDDLRDLFAQEREAYTEDLAARDAVLRRLQAAIVLAPLAGASSVGAGAGTAGAGAAKAAGVTAMGWKGTAAVGVLAFGAGLGLGEGHRMFANRHETSPSSAVVTPSAHSAPLAPATDAPVLPASAPPVPPPPRVLPPSPIPAAPTGDLQAERVLIDTARTALARGMAVDALAATAEHAKRFPRGSLTEEREALAVQALTAKGDAAAARARGTRFRKSYPESIFRPAVEQALESLGD